MSSFLSELGGITAGVGAEGLAFAAGFAAAHALEPEAVLIAQDAWNAAQTKRLDPLTCAAVAAEALAQEGDMATEASYSGIDSSRFAYLYNLDLTAPGTGELLNMLRRNDEVAIDFKHGLRKAKLETQWDDAIKNLRDVRIPAPDLAYMWVRDIVPDPFGYSGPTGPDDTSINDIPQLKIDTLAEAAKTGWDPLRFEAMAARSGLAPAPVMAANAYFRDLATWDQYLTMIKKGDLRPAYANVILNTARQIPTAGEGVQYQLRGFTDRTGRLKLTKRHGMSDADSDILYNIAGRAPSDRQVYIGLARGAKYPSTYDDVPSPFKEAIQRSDIRPEFADIVYQNRYSLPSAFVVRALLTDGAIDVTRGTTILEHEGWPPDLAALVASHYATAPSSGGDKHVAKAETQLWTATHRSYIAEEIDDATATAALTTAGVAAGSIPAVLAIWQQERALIRKQLSPTQIRKAVSGAVINPATGVVWTQADALAALLARGYDQADAETFLAE